MSPGFTNVMRTRQVSHIYICDQHKNMIQSARSRRRRRDSEEADEEAEQPEIDLYNLQINTLRRYKRHYGLSSRPGLNKAQLAEGEACGVQTTTQKAAGVSWIGAQNV